MLMSAWTDTANFVAWFQESPWGFISLLLALLGLLMAGISLLQMFFGRPDIAIKFSKSKAGEQTLEGIGMHINNRPISNPVLRWMGVLRTTADDVVCHYRVCEAASGKEIAAFFPAIVPDMTKQHSHRTTLGASRYITYVSLGLVKDKRFYLDLGNMKMQQLPTGKYKIYASVEWAGKPLANERYLIVRDSDPYGFWENES